MTFIKLDTYRKSLEEIKYKIKNLSIEELEDLDITDTNEVACVKGFITEGEYYIYGEREEFNKKISKDLKKIEKKCLINKIIKLKGEFQGKKFTYTITFSPNKMFFSSNNDVVRRANKKKGLDTVRILDAIDLKQVMKNLETEYKNYLIEVKTCLILNATKLVRSDKYKDVYQKMVDANEFDRYTYYHIVDDRKDFLKKIGFSESELKKYGVHTEEKCFGHTCGITAIPNFKDKTINVIAYSSDD